MNTAPTLHAALVQHAFTADRQANVSKSLDAIRQAQRAGASLVVLSELHTSPYFCQVEDPGLCAAAEPIPGPLTDRFAAAARAHGVVVVGSFFERRAAGLYHNTM